ncbi:hypothetical protein KK090_02570 [Curtobacterium flaccumfaciens pv. poinsettiae]|uniref:hypothetical protein n=1 Tax=Curtobacterium poinsettiae TaxID=159612 RepID=UPI001BE10589|nr:hypothetical protein [Curtobacterium flaccumfaciens]MBT1618132.1 hypothetical protein [Curtobacterium flaccumfaciens pv. poinsettiae]
MRTPEDTKAVQDALAAASPRWGSSWLMREAYEMGSRASAWREVISGLTWALGSAEVRYSNVTVDGFDDDAVVRLRLFTDVHLIMADVAGDESKRDTSITVIPLGRLNQVRLLRTPPLTASESGFTGPKRMRLALDFDGTPEPIYVGDEQTMTTSTALADYSETLLAHLR